MMFHEYEYKLRDRSAENTNQICCICALKHKSEKTNVCHSYMDIKIQIWNHKFLSYKFDYWNTNMIFWNTNLKRQMWVIQIWILKYKSENTNFCHTNLITETQIWYLDFGLSKYPKMQICTF